MKFDEMTLMELITASKLVDKTKFTMVYWIERTEHFEKEFDMDQINARALVLFCLQTSEELEYINIQHTVMIEEIKTHIEKEMK